MIIYFLCNTLFNNLKMLKFNPEYTQMDVSKTKVRKSI